MALEQVGAMFLSPWRDLHGRRSCTIECVQMDTPLPGYDRLSVQGRLNTLYGASLLVDVAVRVDYSSTESLPPEGDERNLLRWLAWMQALAADPALGRARWFIVGNEPQLEHKSATWAARCAVGYGTDSAATNNAWQFVRAINGAIDVLLPAIAPWTVAMDGDSSSYPAPPDRRPGLMPWERYMFSLADHAFNNNWHVPYEHVHLAMHTYANMAAAAAVGDPALEPTYDLRDLNWQNAHNGSRTFEDLAYQIIQAASGSEPAILLSEWNTYINGSWPCDNYVAGALVNLARQYLTFKPNLMGLAVFVDTNYAGGPETWLKCSATGYLDTSGALTRGQKARLQALDADMNELLAHGW